MFSAKKIRKDRAKHVVVIFIGTDQKVGQHSNGVNNITAAGNVVVHRNIYVKGGIGHKETKGRKVERMIVRINRQPNEFSMNVVMKGSQC